MAKLRASGLPGLFPYLKMEIDRDRERKWRSVLTGSNQFALAKNLSESLVGRIGLLSLLPLERGEMPEAARRSQALLGSYPELATRSGMLLRRHLPRARRPGGPRGRQARDFLELLQLLAVRTAQEYNASAFARDLGVDSKTVEAWVSALEASHIVFKPRPFHANLGKRLIKRPKLYFWDTGLACHLAGIRSGEGSGSRPPGRSGLREPRRRGDAQGSPARFPIRLGIVYRGEDKSAWPRPGSDYMNFESFIGKF